MKTIIRDIRLGHDIRKNTVKLKNMIQEDHSLKIDKDFIEVLMNQDDWKVRKNASTIIGYYQDQNFAPFLFDHYAKEINYIVKAEMIHVLSSYPYEVVGKQFEMIFEQLNKVNDESNERHIQEMLSVIVNKMAANNQVRKPVFTGLKKDMSVVMTCLKCNQDFLYDRVIQPKKRVSLGIMVKTNDLKPLAKYREVEDYLFLLTNFKDVDFEYNSIAEALASSNLLALLDLMHDAVPYYLFRVDTSNIEESKIKNEFVQKLSMAIQSKFNHRLYNSTSNYSIELQLREMKEGKVRMFLKLYTYEDPRFNYRVETNSNSLAPHIAASIVQLARPYLQEKADVVDLCCGTGTLLIERCFELRAHFLIGVDSFGKAIEGAKKNTSITRMDINFVNRDFGDFSHPHLFDEIISDLPVTSTKTTYEMLEGSYKSFMKTASKILKKDGYLIVYTTEAKTLRKVLRFNKEYFQFLEEFHMALKNTEATLFVLQRL